MQPATYENQTFFRSILMIDPQEEIIEFIRLMFSVIAYKVEGCQSGREGIEIATRTQPDLMIVELVLPDMDGLALLQRLRTEEIMSDRPIIVLTSLDDTQVQLQANSVGISAFMSKPFDIFELMDLIRSLIKPDFDLLWSSHPPRLPGGIVVRLPPSPWLKLPLFDQHNFPRCPHCRAGIRPGDNFCLSCGKPIPPATINSR